MSKKNSMELLPKEIEITLPKMYETEKIVTSKKILHVRYISIFSDWEWYLCEYDSNSKTAFGVGGSLRSHTLTFIIGLLRTPPPLYSGRSSSVVSCTK